MLTTFRADLHLHTCLSPCGEDEMRPLAIVRHAKRKGLQVIAICDHNSTRNVGAACRAGRHEGLTVIGGVEISSEEEVHILGLFDEEESLQDMQHLIDNNLSGENNAELFGEQSVCDDKDVIVAREAKLLIGATKLTVEQIVESIHRLDGLAIASHVDRESFSILSQLGFVPEQLQIDAVEISPLHSVSEAKDRFPQIKNYTPVRFSDAHRLKDIGVVWTVVPAASRHMKELDKARLGKNGRAVMN